MMYGPSNMPPEYRQFPPPVYPQRRKSKAGKVVLTVFLSYVSFYVLIFSLLLFIMKEPIIALCLLAIPALLPLVWLGKKKRKPYLIQNNNTKKLRLILPRLFLWKLLEQKIIVKSQADSFSVWGF